MGDPEPAYALLAMKIINEQGSKVVDELLNANVKKSKKDDDDHIEL